jgi:hypothetical protein
MSYTSWKVEHVPYNNGWSASPVEITEIFDPQFIVNLGDAKNSFKFKLSFFFKCWNKIFETPPGSFVSSFI